MKQRPSISPEERHAAGLSGWRTQEDGEIRARFATKNFSAGVELVIVIGELAEAADHHPDVLLTYPSVDVSLISHDVSAVTSRDLDLARAITDAAKQVNVPIVRE